MELPFHIWVDDLNPSSGSKVIVVGVSIKGKDINKYLGSLGHNTVSNNNVVAQGDLVTVTTVTCYIASTQFNTTKYK